MSKSLKNLLTLYKVDWSPPVRSVLMVLEYLKLPVKTIEVNLLKGEHLKPEFKKINPQHTVPTLVDDGFVLADSHAICSYLINKYSNDDSLYPSEPKLRAIVDHRMHFDNGILFPNFRAAFRQVVIQGKRQVSQNYLDSIKSAYGIADQFATKTWFAGEQFTLADICCIATVSSLNEVMPIEASKFPNMLAWFQRCLELELYKTSNEPGIKKMVDLYRTSLANN